MKFQNLNNRRLKYPTKPLNTFENARELLKKVKAWAIRWGYKGVSDECMKELEEIFGEELSK